jgi:hypothetical protein
VVRQQAQRQRLHRRGRRLLAAAAVAAGVMVPTALAAQEYPTPDDPPSVATDPSDPADPAVSDPSATGSGGSTLPVTGGQIAGLTLIGLGAAGAGVVLVRMGRRPAREPLSL